MSHRPYRPANTLGLVLLLALMNIAALIGMLIADGFWDGIFFLLAALPLLTGALLFWRRGFKPGR